MEVNNNNNNKTKENSKKTTVIKNSFSNNNSVQEKILRSKSKNMYPSRKSYKKKTNDYYPFPRFAVPPDTQKDEINSNENCIKDIKNPKKNDLLELKLLHEENKALKKSLIQQEELLKQLHDLFINNYTRINSLRKKYSNLKHYLKKTIYEESEINLIKEKAEEELALRAVEQQIIDELCPNPDSMSYEQLLQLEENLGSVNKGLTKDKIKKIPIKPFRKVLFDDNLKCIICMDDFEENEKVKQLGCGHIFHGECIDKWLEKQKNCPFCKAEVN